MWPHGLGLGLTDVSLLWLVGRGPPVDKGLGLHVAFVD